MHKTVGHSQATQTQRRLTGKEESILSITLMLANQGAWVSKILALYQKKMKKIVKLLKKCIAWAKILIHQSFNLRIRKFKRIRLKKKWEADLAKSYIKNLRKKMWLMRTKDIHRTTNSTCRWHREEIASQVPSSSLSHNKRLIQESLTALLMMNFNFRNNRIWMPITKCFKILKKYSNNIYNKTISTVQICKFRLKRTRWSHRFNTLINLIIKMIHKLKKDLMLILEVMHHDLPHLSTSMKNKTNLL